MTYERCKNGNVGQTRGKESILMSWDISLVCIVSTKSLWWVSILFNIQFSSSKRKPFDFSVHHQHHFRSRWQKRRRDTWHRNSRTLVWLRHGRCFLVATCLLLLGRVYRCHIHPRSPLDSHKILLQNIVEQVIQHNCAGDGPNNGNVFLFLRPSNAHEYASRISRNYHWGSRRTPF